MQVIYLHYGMEEIELKDPVQHTWEKICDNINGIPSSDEAWSWYHMEHATMLQVNDIENSPAYWYKHLHIDECDKQKQILDPYQWEMLAQKIC